MFSPASNKAKLCSKILRENSNFNDSGSSLPGFPSGTNVKLHSISVTPKMIKTSGPVCILFILLYHLPQGGKATTRRQLTFDQWWFWRGFLFQYVFGKILIFRMLESLIFSPCVLNFRKRSIAENVCYVSLRLDVTKNFEKLVNNRLVNLPDKWDLFFDFQSAFRSFILTQIVWQLKLVILLRYF